IGMLGILKAGGAYVPLDPTYPTQRISDILADSQVPILLTQQKLKSKLPAYQGQIMCLDSDWRCIALETREKPMTRTRPNNLAYIIYTSGSTGKPKGVMIEHRSVVNYVYHTCKLYALRPADRVLLFSSISFDSSVDEIFCGLCCGSTLVIRTTEMLDSIQKFLEMSRRW
ncbi:MAG: AMP-binding protein, partial [Lewinella sp.]|nr:AMP-binding protein [Lewinella sp.]